MGPTRLIDCGSIPADSLDYYRSRAYFCPCCGRIWCKWEKETEDLFGQNWFVYYSSCPDHQKGVYSFDTPGSICLVPKDIIVLPRSMLEYELLNYWRNNEQHAPVDDSNPDSDANASSAGSNGAG